VALTALARLRLMMAVGTLLAVGVITAGLWRYSPPAAQGLLLGAAAGLVPFLILTWRVERVVARGEDRLHLEMARWAVIRLLLYVAVLIRSYFLDPTHQHGVLGAVAGIFLVKLVLAFITLSGLDQKTLN
jgi:hypothetical protein